MHASRIPALIATLAFALAGCGNHASSSTATATASTAGDATNEATATSQGITLRASVVETAELQESVAHGYRIARQPNQALLLLTVRDAQGDNATPVSLQATVSD